MGQAAHEEPPRVHAAPTKECVNWGGCKDQGGEQARTAYSGMEQMMEELKDLARGECASSGQGI